MGSIKEVLLGKEEGKEVEIRGWVWRARSSGGVSFVVVRDSTGVLQVTVRKGSVPDADHQAASRVGIESSVLVRGRVALEERAPGGVELRATSFKVVGESRDFPIYESTVEAESEDVLLDRRHLWIRSRKLTQAMIVKAKLLRAARDWFEENGFVETTPSVITTNACEGGSTLFTFDYFGKEAYLSQSAQMYLEALIFSLERVYSLTPSFRAEKSRTRKHLTEYGHLEAEAAWVRHEENLEIQEKLVSYVARRVAKEAEEELVALGREPSDLEKIVPPFDRITYDDAVEELRRHGFPDFRWGEDFGAPHEVALTEGRTRPLFVTHWPLKIKAFYMAPDDDGTHARCADLLAPEGYGEIIGGSERSLDIETMKRRLKEEGAKVENYEWYFDLRRYGSVPHSGFGLGVERLLTWLVKGSHVRDATPFPRTPARAYP